MANIVVLVSLFLIFATLSSPLPSCALSSCNGPCRTQDDYSNQLICINGKCNDAPKIETHICTGGSRVLLPDNSSKPSSTLICKGRSHLTFTCSLPVTSLVKANLTLNDFSKKGDGGAPSNCDGKFHEKTKRVVALSNGWYTGGSRCGRMTKICANGRSVLAKVDDGCDSEHAGQPPCGNNVVDGSDVVWEVLGLKKDLGVVYVTSTMI